MFRAMDVLERLEATYGPMQQGITQIEKDKALSKIIDDLEVQQIHLESLLDHMYNALYEEENELIFDEINKECKHIGWQIVYTMTGFEYLMGEDKCKTIAEGVEVLNNG